MDFSKVAWKQPLGRKTTLADVERDTYTAERSRQLRKGRGFAASSAQRKKAKGEPCVVTGESADESWNPIDPAHIYPGGCDDPLCVVPLNRWTHRAFDTGTFDLLPYLVKHRVPELCHALEHYGGDIIALYQRLTGERIS